MIRQSKINKIDNYQQSDVPLPGEGQKIQAKKKPKERREVSKMEKAKNIVFKGAQDKKVKA